MVRIIFLLIFVLTGIFCRAVTDTSERIFDPKYKTLKTCTADDFMSPSVIRLGTNDRIVVTFDEIGEDNSYLEYRLVHCNADWQPSRLVESEYLDGFNYAKIEDYAFSSNTYVHYVNYRIELPNEDMNILRSGNYLLQVYDPESPEDIILQTRFQVSENIVGIRGEVTSRTDRGHYSGWQQLGMEINVEALGDCNPYQDIKVQVRQNVSESNARQLRNPLRINGRTLVYDHTPELIFPASNEYRRFESVSNSFPGMHVDSLRYMGSNYHVWLKEDYERSGREYSYDRTQHGRFLVHEYNATDSDIGADYITVHFALDIPEMKDKDVYIDGEFVHDRYDDANRMAYNPIRNRYEAQIPMKQGAYNYRYVVIDKGSMSSPDAGTIEGNKYETDNEYCVSVWYSAPGSRADRLVGSKLILQR